MESSIYFVADGVKSEFDCIWHGQAVKITFAKAPEPGIIIKLVTKE